MDAVEATGGNLAAWIVNPDLAAVQHVPADDWFIEGDRVRVMTSAEQATRNAARAEQQRTQRREFSRLLVSGNDHSIMVLRCLLKVILRPYLAKVAASTNDTVARANELTQRVNALLAAGPNGNWQNIPPLPAAPLNPLTPPRPLPELLTLLRDQLASGEGDAENAT